MRRSIVLWTACGALALAFPFLPGMGSSAVGAANTGASYAMAALSLVLLTGWVGQISLGHAAFVGVGAYGTGWAANALGLPFPVNVPVAALFGGLAAVVLGVVALRVRGLFLAVATLIFSWMASEFLFRQQFVRENEIISTKVIGGEGVFPSFDFTQRRTFFYVAWAVVAATAFVVTSIRDSKTGRAFFAVRGSEMASASLGIDVTRYKLLSFAISGAVAGIAGNLLISDARAVVSDQFTFTASLFYLAIAVVGGLRSVPGALASALLFAALNELFFRVPSLGGYLELVSAGLLAVTLVAYPGGIAAVGQALGRRARQLKLLVGEREGRDRLRRLTLPAAVRDRIPAAQLEKVLAVVGRLRTRKLEPQPLLDWTSPAATAARPAAAPDDAPASSIAAASMNGNGNVRSGRRRMTDPPERAQTEACLRVDAVTMQFGGLRAVDHASLEVRAGEITGLIGPNGAGKTTLFNCIAGFLTPTTGSVHLFGNDVTALPVHERARLGVARTFQAIQLIPQLTVFENLMVATHAQNPTGVLSHLAVTQDALRYEAQARARVRHCLGLLELDAIADRKVTDLSFGVLRMVEIARAMVTGFRLMMLDEPASGLDTVETEHLADVVRFVRSLGVTVLLIEHDVEMVTSVSDYLYVLEQGQIIAEGHPIAVQRDPAVIAAYLGEPAEATV